ncbi:MAG: signal peptidase I [Acholeplasma sp.]|nr:signal peptidase I [Acholeplasma sp.]
MKIKDIAAIIESGEAPDDALKSLKQKRLFKWLSLALVSFVAVGLTLLYLVRDERTFSSQTQKVILLILSSVLLIVSVSQVASLNKENVTLKKAFDRFKFTDLFTFISISIIVILHITTFYFVTAEVNQSSMTPTLNDQDRLIVYQFDYLPVRNDIVVIFMDETHYLRGDDTHYVKRVVALPGDTMSLNGSNDLLVNGNVIQRLPNEHVDAVSKLISELDGNIIPEGFYFVLGDNIANSHDSRSIGLIYEQDIVAKVIFRFYPKFGGVK